MNNTLSTCFLLAGSIVAAMLSFSLKPSNLTEMLPAASNEGKEGASNKTSKCRKGHVGKSLGRYGMLSHNTACSGMGDGDQLVKVWLGGGRHEALQIIRVYFWAAAFTLPLSCLSHRCAVSVTIIPSTANCQSQGLPRPGNESELSIAPDHAIPSPSPSSAPLGSASASEVHDGANLQRSANHLQRGAEARETATSPSLSSSKGELNTFRSSTADVDRDSLQAISLDRGSRTSRLPVSRNAPFHGTGTSSMGEGPISPRTQFRLVTTSCDAVTVPG